MNAQSSKYTLIKPNDTISTARALYDKTKEVDALIVVEHIHGKDNLIGLVTRRDLRFVQATHQPVSNIMTLKERLVTLSYKGDRDDILERAAELLDEVRTKRVLLVDDDFCFRGMVHEEDVVERKLRCFSILAFKSPYMDVYTDHVKPILETEYNIIIERADEIFNTGSIIETIQKRIINSDFIIADVSVQNPNVYYEVGFAHALKKNIVFITHDIEKVPFDIRDHRCIIYDYSPKGVKLLEEHLRKAINEVLGQLSRVNYFVRSDDN